MKTLPLTEFRQLLAGVSEHGTQHLCEVEADLSQTAYLLQEAIDKLGSCFMSIHEAVTAQQRALDALVERHAISEAEAAQIRDYRLRIGRQVDLAVTSMQFQDMTNQLIGRSLKRINGFRELLEALAIHGQDMSADCEHEEIARLLEDMSHNLTKHSHALQGGLRQSVNQQHLGSGEIELF